MEEEVAEGSSENAAPCSPKRLQKGKASVASRDQHISLPNGFCEPSALAELTTGANVVGRGDISNNAVGCGLDVCENGHDDETKSVNGDVICTDDLRHGVSVDYRILADAPNGGCRRDTPENGPSSLLSDHLVSYREKGVIQAEANDTSCLGSTPGGSETTVRENLALVPSDSNREPESAECLSSPSNACLLSDSAVNCSDSSVSPPSQPVGNAGAKPLVSSSSSACSNGQLLPTRNGLANKRDSVSDLAISAQQEVRVKTDTNSCDSAEPKDNSEEITSGQTLVLDRSMIGSPTCRSQPTSSGGHVALAAVLATESDSTCTKSRAAVPRSLIYQLAPTSTSVFPPCSTGPDQIPLRNDPTSVTATVQSCRPKMSTTDAASSASCNVPTSGNSCRGNAVALELLLADVHQRLTLQATGGETTGRTTTDATSTCDSLAQLAQLTAAVTNGEDELRITQYQNELQLPAIMALITKDLSEPYSIYTYRYFIHNWPHLCFMPSKWLSMCLQSAICNLLRASS